MLPQRKSLERRKTWFLSLLGFVVLGMGFLGNKYGCVHIYIYIVGL